MITEDFGGSFDPSKFQVKKPGQAEPAPDPTPAGDPPAGDPPAGDPPAGDPPAGGDDKVAAAVR